MWTNRSRLTTAMAAVALALAAWPGRRPEQERPVPPPPRWSTPRTWTRGTATRWVGVCLNTVRLYGSSRYYARMAIEFFVSGKARWQAGWYPHYNCPGCTAFWGSFPNAWPYF